ncbi:hypothetical protein H0H81_008508 [Sphagnurus paluster]|uniref:Uncharacterized protein n=1 Tax=Sphagnurus paluster TaxID=117069 RepID=A0A9P7GR33_9AGAR|nr:hypothetical protein H0H81_008508 [Sphagnurus paluster]
MAHLTRPAKSASDWSMKELFAYNIDVSMISPSEFFTDPDPSIDDLDPAILNSPSYDNNPALSALAGEYLSYLNLAVRPNKERLTPARNWNFLASASDAWRTDAKAHIVAQAIAAFQFNNRSREEFVPVTRELSNAVSVGQYPADQTRVW